MLTAAVISVVVLYSNKQRKYKYMHFFKIMSVYFVGVNVIVTLLNMLHRIHFALEGKHSLQLLKKPEEQHNLEKRIQRKMKHI